MSILCSQYWFRFTHNFTFTFTHHLFLQLICSYWARYLSFCSTTLEQSKLVAVDPNALVVIINVNGPNSTVKKNLIEIQVLVISKKVQNIRKIYTCMHPIIWLQNIQNKNGWNRQLFKFLNLGLPNTWIMFLLYLYSIHLLGPLFSVI